MGSEVPRRLAQCWGHVEGVIISSRRNTLLSLCSGPLIRPFFSLLSSHAWRRSEWHDRRAEINDCWLLSDTSQSISRTGGSHLSYTAPHSPHTHPRWHMSFSELICMVGQHSLQSCTEHFCTGHSLKQKSKQPYAGLPCAFPRFDLGILDLGRLSIPFKWTQIIADLEVREAIPCLEFSNQHP